MIVLTDDWLKQDAARAVPGAYWSTERKAWVLDQPTPRAAAVALALFPNLHNTHPELVDIRAELVQDVRPVDHATPYDRDLMPWRVMVSLGEREWNLFKYQERDLGYVDDVLRVHKGAYIGWERGMGKTLAAACLFDSLDVNAGLVIAPNTAKESVWAAELEWMTPWLEVVVLPNDKAKRERALEYVRLMYRGSGRPFVLVVHYEALAVIAGKTTTKRGTTGLGDGWKKLGITWDLMVADEGHRFKNPKTQMTRAAKKIPAERRLLMSGSIISNHLEEMYGPLSILFPDRYKSKWRDWNDRYLDYVESGYSRVCVGVKPERVDDLRAELGVFMVYRRKEDELDLPEKTEQQVHVDLSPAQRKAYDQLVDECLTQLADGTVIKADAGAPMLVKLRQVATGLDALSSEVVDSTKLDLAVEMILDAEDDAFVVFSWYKAVARALVERLEAKGVKAFVVDGDVGHAERATRIKAFQQGERRVFIGTISTLGESVNLQRANNAIFLDRSWSPGDNTQAADRIYRQGQTKKVTITHLIARDTVDELAVMPSLSNKEFLRDLILGGTT